MVVSLRFKETGSVTTYQPNGRKGVRLGAVSDGGAIAIFHKTGDPIIDLHPGDYGNGVVGAWNRKGKRRTLKPGPWRAGNCVPTDTVLSF